MREISANARLIQGQPMFKVIAGRWILEVLRIRSDGVFARVNPDRFIG